MDRNDRQNSFMNTQNSRGKDKKIKKYRTRSRVAVTLVVILLFLTGVLGTQNYMLRKDQKNGRPEKEQTEVQSNAEQESKIEKTQKENSQEPSDNTQVSETPMLTEETATPTLGAITPTEIPVTPGPETEQSEDSEEDESINKTFTELSSELDEKLKETDISYQIKGLGVYETASCGAVKEPPEGLPEYAKLYIMGEFYNRIGKSGNEEDYIRDNEEETDLSSFILAMIDRTNDMGYTDENGQAGKEILLRLGENSERRDSRSQKTGYTDESAEGYEEDLEKGIEKVNEYIRQILGTGESEKTIDKDLNNNLTLTDCEKVFNGLFVDGEEIDLEEGQAETMRQRLSAAPNKENPLVSAIPWEGEKAKNRIWISGESEGRKTTILGVMDPETDKGYILSVTGAIGEKEYLKELSATVFQNLIGSDEE